VSSHPAPDNRSSPDDPRPQEQQLELGEDESTIALRKAWERTLRDLSGQFNKPTFENWLRPLKPLSWEGVVVVLGAPSSFARNWAEKKYTQVLQESLGQHLGRPGLQVRFVISTPDVQPLLGEKPLPLQQAASPTPAAELVPAGEAAPRTPVDSRNPFALELAAAPLNDRYTFEHFVVGKSNQFAHAGALAVAHAVGTAPSATHMPSNPLFLYGSPGLGKCVAASEYLHLADGRRVQAGDLIGTQFPLLTLAKEEIRAVPARAEFNAVEPVWAIETESGRRIVRNAQHPLWVGRGILTRGKNYGRIHVRGWTALADIQPGDLVAVPECLPAFGSPISLPEHEIKLLGSRAEADGIPASAWTLPPGQLRLFLSRLFATDGWASYSPHKTGSRSPRIEIGYCSASEGLVRDVQELLLKLGILSRISHKPKVNAWTLAIHASSEILNFCARVGIFGKEEAVERVRRVAEAMRQSRPNRGAWRHNQAPAGLRWEKVVSVESAGAEATVAIEVPDYQTFLTTFWEHNTHLMHAIGHEVRARLPQARIAYVSGEMFTNHFVMALRDKRTEDFRRAYRSVDMWLVDDIQSIAMGQKEQTKEEFFHTFNTLHQMNRQIVIASDRPPRELRAMDERLRSRFMGGLVVDIAPPELEMRMAILQKKALLENLRIPDEVIAFMASLIQSNIRALEGALIKLMAYASLAKSPVTKQLASDVLGSYFLDPVPQAHALASAHPEDYADERPGPAAPPSRPGGQMLDRIVNAVASQTGVPRELILSGGGRAGRGGRRIGDAGYARQAAMYLAKEISGLPMSTVAEAFGCKTHAAITHAHARLREEIQSDPQVLQLMTRIREAVNG